MIIKSLIIQTLSTAVLTGLLWLIGDMRQFPQVIAGSTVMGLNLALIVWLTRRIIYKKSVALALFVIVFKYAALIGLLIFLSSVGFEIGFPFALGVSAVFPTLIFLGYYFMKSSEENGSF